MGPSGMTCDAGPGAADYVVEIPRKKGKSFGVFRLCAGHADNVLAADPNAKFKELPHGRPDEDPGGGADAPRACNLLDDYSE